MVEHVCNPSNREAEKKEQRVQDQSILKQKSYPQRDASSSLYDVSEFLNLLETHHRDLYSTSACYWPRNRTFGGGGEINELTRNSQPAVDRIEPPRVNRALPGTLQTLLIVWLPFSPGLRIISLLRSPFCTALIDCLRSPAFFALPPKHDK